MKKEWLAWLLFALLALTWGSSFILMKLGLRAFDSYQIGMLRIALAFWFTLLIALRRLRNFRRADAWPLLVVGLFGNAIPYVLFPLAVKMIPSGLVGVLNSLVPLFTLLIGILLFNLKVGWRSITGILVGLAGAMWLLLPGLEIDSTRLIYGSLPIIATIGYAISINTISARLQHLDSLTITLLSLSFVGIPASLYVLSTDFLAIMASHEEAWSSFAYVTLLAVFGTSLAVIIFNQLIKTAGSLFAASVTYAIPIVALLWGIAFGEALGLEHVIGMGAILFGVYLVNRRRRKELRAKEAEARRQELEGLPTS